MVLAAPSLLLTPPPSSSPVKTPHRSYSAQIQSQNDEKTARAREREFIGNFYRNSIQQDGVGTTTAKSVWCREGARERERERASESKNSIVRTPCPCNAQNTRAPAHTAIAHRCRPHMTKEEGEG
jgi:hypothetical protein